MAGDLMADAPAGRSSIVGDDYAVPARPAVRQELGTVGDAPGQAIRHRFNLMSPGPCPTALAALID